MLPGQGGDGGGQVSGHERQVGSHHEVPGGDKGGGEGTPRSSSLGECYLYLARPGMECYEYTRNYLIFI